VQGGVLAASQGPSYSEKDHQALVQTVFDKHWAANKNWAKPVLVDALAFAKSAQPRPEDVLSRIQNSSTEVTACTSRTEMASLFAENVWPSLKYRGWKAETLSEGHPKGTTQYSFEGKQVSIYLLCSLGI